jgi:hypothetical protein
MTATLSIGYAVPLERRTIRRGAVVVASIVMLPDYQVRIAPGGVFHRRGAIDGECACGARIPEVHSMRDYLLDEHLCRECFTRHELELGELAAANRVTYPTDYEPLKKR